MKDGLKLGDVTRETAEQKPGGYKVNELMKDGLNLRDVTRETAERKPGEYKVNELMKDVLKQSHCLRCIMLHCLTRNVSVIVTSSKVYYVTLLHQ